MKKTVFFGMLWVSLAAFSQQQASTGKIDHYESFASKNTTARAVDVWLPEGYSNGKKYDVVYMHDGQNLFDASTTWNKQSWEADSTAGKLMAEKRIRQAIIVGIHNLAAERFSDYFPQKPFESLGQKSCDSLYTLEWNGSKLFAKPVGSDAYLKFIVSELKPFIDKTYSVYTDKAHTFISGSSMGGLISLYAICEYPEVFGGAACLSTHWPGTFAVQNNPIPPAFFAYMKSHLPDPKTHKLYFDYGDQSLDALYPPLHKKATEAAHTKGFTEEKNLMVVFAPGENHSEKSWRKRFGNVLLFLLQP